MSINPNRLLTMLRPEGFTTGRSSSAERSYSFVRNDKEAGLFQWIMIDCAGRKGHAMVGSVAASVTRKVAVKGLIEVKLLEEIAQVPDRGWTVVRSPKEAAAWESEVARVAPARAAEWAAEVGPDLLRRTQSARRSAVEYAKRLDLREPVSSQLTKLLGLTDARVTAEAERLANWPGVLQAKGAEGVYLLSCLCVLHFEAEVERTADSFVGQDPLTNTELMWRVQLVADCLLAAGAAD